MTWECVGNNDAGLNFFCLLLYSVYIYLAVAHILLGKYILFSLLQWRLIEIVLYFPYYFIDIK